MRSGKKFQKLKAANKLDQSLSHYEPFLMPSVNFECVAELLLCVALFVSAQLPRVLIAMQSSAHVQRNVVLCLDKPLGGGPERRCEAPPQGKTLPARQRWAKLLLT